MKLDQNPAVAVVFCSSVFFVACQSSGTVICDNRDKPCPDNQLCVSPEDLPEGHIEQAGVPACYQVCSLKDGSIAECPEGKACLGDKGQGGFCLYFSKICRDRKCPPGYHCNAEDRCIRNDPPSLGGGCCLHPAKCPETECQVGLACGNGHDVFICCAEGERCCEEDADCPANFSCDPATHTCHTSCGSGSEEKESHCRPGFHCEDDQCLEDVPDGGTCTGDEDSDCRAGLHCQNGLCCTEGLTCCNHDAHCDATHHRCDTVTNSCFVACGVGSAEYDSMCQAEYHCDNDHCLPNAAAGGACTEDEDSDCDFGLHCENDRCCAEGSTCCAFDSHCSATRNACDVANGACWSGCGSGNDENDSRCQAGYHCENDACEADVAAGGVCTDEDSDCEPGLHCQNDLCCVNGAVCCAENTDCDATSYLCDTSTGICMTDCGTGTGEDDTLCQPEFHCENNACVPDVAAGDPCTNNEDSDCQEDLHCDDICIYDVPLGGSCTGNEDSDCQDNLHCDDTCVADVGEGGPCTDNEDSDCQDGLHCDDTCVPDVAEGGLCTDNEDSDCQDGLTCENSVCCADGVSCCTENADCIGQTGLFCVDHVCCVSPCTDLCFSCDGLNTEDSHGSCAPVTDGLDPDYECEGDATCDGAGVCWAKNPDEDCDNAFECVNGKCDNGVCGRNVVSIANGFNHSCALLDDGQVKCWGSGSFGELGLGDRSSRGGFANQMGQNLPAVVLGTERTALAITGGWRHTCARLDNHQVKCWGDNGDGQLGLGDTNDRGDEAGEMGDNLSPVSLGADRTALDIVAGSYHTCALLDNHQVKCWGKNGGRLGYGDINDRGDEAGEMGDNLPAVSLGADRTVLAIAAGFYHTCALLETFQVKCWGGNNFGQLGLGDSDNRGGEAGEMGNNLPVVFLGADRTAQALVVGHHHTCVVLDNDQVKCWGQNHAGQLGVGDASPRGNEAGEMGDNLPVVSLGTDRTALALVGGGAHTCAVLDNHQVKCWGDNYSGQLGLGDHSRRGDYANEMGDNLPAVSLGAGRSAQALAAGDKHTCALLDNHQVKCWGKSFSGQLGLGDRIGRGYNPGEMGDNLPFVDL